MKITRRKLRQIIREELVREIRASPAHVGVSDFPARPITDLSWLGHPPEDSVRYAEPEEEDLDPDDDSDDMAELLDMMVDEFTKDELAAFEVMIGRARRQGEKSSDVVGRLGGDPYRVMSHVTGRSAGI